MSTLIRGPDIDDPLERARKERDHWRSLFESVVERYPEPILVVDADGQLTHWNEETAALTGVSPADAVGESAREIAGVDEGESTIAEQVVETESAVRAEEVRSGTSAAGERWHTRDVAAPMLDDDGQVVGAFEIASDVTDLIEEREAIERLQAEISGQILENVLELEETAETVTNRSEEIATLATRQSDTTDDVTAEIGNLTATIEEIASTASEVEGQSSDAVDIASESSAAADSALERMDEITAATETVTDRVAELEAAVEEIDEGVEMLDTIADQTNMIALNASIEAARAGSGGGGDGFSVVAAEVKSLAEQAGERATDIERLVDRVTELTAETQESATQAHEAVEDGSARVVDALNSIDDIIDVLEEVANGASQVARATDEQATSTENVANMVEQTSERADQVKRAVADITAETETNRQETKALREAIRELGQDSVEGVDSDSEIGTELIHDNG